MLTCGGHRSKLGAARFVQQKCIMTAQHGVRPAQVERLALLVHRWDLHAMNLHYEVGWLTAEENTL